MRRLGSLPYVLPAVVLGAWAYWPITANYFHADDFQHLYLIADGRLGEFLVTPYGGHMLVARNALFALSHALFGVDPRGYFWLALLTHLLNIALLYAVIAAWTGRRRLAGGGAALWAISPLNTQSLGWYSVYGQVALTTLVLAVLWRVAAAAGDGRPLPRRDAVAAYLLLLAGSTCFGTGIGIAMAAAVALPLCLPGPRNRFSRRLFMSLLPAVPLLYALVQVLYRLVTGNWHDSVGYARVASGGLLAIASMTVQLLGFGIGRTLTAVWLPDAAYPGALPLAALALYVAIVGLALWRGETGRRRAILACLLLATGAYGIIATGRGAVGGFAALGQASRYHYVAPVPLVIAGCLALSVVAARLRARIGAVILLGWLAALAFGTYRWPPVIDHYDAERKIVATLQAIVAARAKSALPGQVALVANRPMLPLNYFSRMNEFPGWTGLFVIFYPSNQVDGHPIRFVTLSPSFVAQVRQRPGSRAAELLVTRDEASALIAARAAPPAAAPPPRGAPARPAAPPTVPRSAPARGT
jgi:hypothetical protein